MKEMRFDQIKINCSKIGAIMSAGENQLTPTMEKKYDKLLAKMASGKPLTDRQQEDFDEFTKRIDAPPIDKISKSAKSYLKFLYQMMKYGPQYALRGGEGVEQLVNGIKAEANSVEILQKFYGQPFYKDKRKISNDFIHGKVDIFNGVDIDASSQIWDVKSIVSLTDFMKILDQQVRPIDSFQMQGYLGITGKESGFVSYVLADYPEDIIFEQWEILFKDLCPDGIETPRFAKRWAFAEASMKKIGIPIDERVITFRIDRDDSVIESIYEKVVICREWLARFHEGHKNLIVSGKKIHT